MYFLMVKSHSFRNGRKTSKMTVFGPSFFHISLNKKIGHLGPFFGAARGPPSKGLISCTGPHVWGPWCNDCSGAWFLCVLACCGTQHVRQHAFRHPVMPQVVSLFNTFNSFRRIVTSFCCSTYQKSINRDDVTPAARGKEHHTAI